MTHKQEAYMKKKRGIVSIVFISIIAVIFIIPLIYMVSTSLKPKSEVLQKLYH